MKIILSEFIKSIKKYKWEFFKTIIWVLVLSLLNALIPYCFKRYLDLSISKNDVAIFAIFLGAFIAYIGIKIICKILWYRSLDSFGGRYLSDTISDCQNKILKDTSYLDLQKNKNTKIKHTLYVDALNSFTAVGHHLPSLISSIFVLVIVFIVSGFVSITLTLVLIGTVLLGFVISILSRRFITKASSITNSHLKEMNYEISSFTDCVELGKANNLGDYFDTKSRKSINSFIKAAKKEDTKTYFWSGLSEGYNTLLTYAVAAILALPFFDGTLINYAFFTLVCAVALEESQTFVGNLRLLFKSEVGFVNINNILNTPSVEKESLDSIDSIYSASLNFSIDEKAIFKDFSFNFKKGDFVRICGPNGSGKSTLIKLISGLYENEEIFFNDGIKGNPINKTLLIDQNEMLLNEKVIDYFSLICHKNVEEEDLITYCKMLNLGKDSLQKQIENYGENLSNGERKKIQIIRLLVVEKDVNLIILDEVMAGLDVETKNILIDHLTKEDSLKNKIIIMIEHDNNLKLPYTQVINLE